MVARRYQSLQRHHSSSRHSAQKNRNSPANAVSRRVTLINEVLFGTAASHVIVAAVVAIAAANIINRRYGQPPHANQDEIAVLQSAAVTAIQVTGALCCMNSHYVRRLISVACLNGT